MGYIGVSLIIASVVWVLVAPPPWMHPFMPPFLAFRRPPPPLPPPRSKSPPRGDANGHALEEERSLKETAKQSAAPAPPSINFPEEPEPATKDRDAMPPPPPPAIRRSSPSPAPVIAEPEEEEQTTPKAKPAAPSAQVPSFSLNEPSSGLSIGASIPGRGGMPPPPVPSLGTSSGLAAGTNLPGRGSMPPPPAPSNMMPPPRGPIPPRLAAFPAANSPQRARPVPNRGPASSGSSLAPPPTHTVKNSKPSRKVILTPGHSPLDWARISGPNADLRNLPPSTPYLKVTPSMLKKMTGRKGKDAWMALGGRVYNITPYLPYHPAGEPELLRGAGRDATKLFGEVHPWVNYETMLAACLVGVLVEEEDVVKPSAMDEMD
ncbi:cytochrome b5-like heme steroid binding domain-containing protein [Colletotrichum sojae]|uniref:Cytochrome b5-like heme steroid binding domain-containing protein n=1 Tax=Colletotrichum sojae TaxID=2175907 RepID=A0A8H6IT85_9PEZI|nr:cytochrome b5-like heme steroid binding domain-containing protein [Colletotrichum sojae]